MKYNIKEIVDNMNRMDSDIYKKRNENIKYINKLKKENEELKNETFANDCPKEIHKFYLKAKEQIEYIEKLQSQDNVDLREFYNLKDYEDRVESAKFCDNQFLDCFLKSAGNFSENVEKYLNCKNLLDPLNTTTLRNIMSDFKTITDIDRRRNELANNILLKNLNAEKERNCNLIEEMIKENSDYLDQKSKEMTGIVHRLESMVSVREREMQNFGLSNEKKIQTEFLNPYILDLGTIKNDDDIEVDIRIINYKKTIKQKDILSVSGYVYDQDKNQDVSSNIFIEQTDGMAGDEFLENLIMNFLLSYPLRYKKVAAIHYQPSNSVLYKIMPRVRDCGRQSDFILNTNVSEVITTTNSIRDTLLSIQNRIEEISTMLGRERERDIYSYNNKHPENPQHIILLIIKDFPNGFDGRDSFNAYKDICKRGNKCGIITVTLYKRSFLESDEKRDEEFIKFVREFATNYRFVEENDGTITLADRQFTPIEKSLYFDYNKFFDNISKDLNNEKPITYEEIGFGNLEPKNKYSSVISIPVGKCGSKVFEIELNCGSKKDGPLNVGYMVIGQTGTGKSSLFHSIIINGSMKYSPEDLQFWLLDFKNGDASDKYKESQLPHISLLSQNNKIGDAYGLFKLLKSELEKRGAIFKDVGKKYNVNITAINEYNRCVDEHREYALHMNRIIVLIDEAQSMFNGDDNEYIDKVGELIRDIAAQMRYVGIHIIMIAQNLSEGRKPILRDNFMNHVAGRITFKLAKADLLKEASFGEGFNNHLDEILHLPQFETYATSDGGEPVKVKMALNKKQDDFEEYFSQIREKYNKFPCKILVTGNNDMLTSTDKTNTGKTYAKLLQNPTEKRTQYEDSYSFVFGEDFYSLEPMKFTLDSSTTGGIVACGTDSRMRSSICRNLLIGVDNLKRKKIYVCNGGGIREQIFNEAINNIKSKDSLIRYKSSEIDELISVIYTEFLKRRKALEDEIVEDNDPVFIIINDISSIVKIAENIVYKTENKDVENKTVVDDTEEENVDKMVSAIKKKFDLLDEEKNINNRYILDIIYDIFNNGATVGIYLSFSTSNLAVQKLNSILSDAKTTNKIFFNEGNFDYCVSRIISSMLDEIKNKDANKGETMAVSVINGVQSKVRPVLYDYNN